MRLVNPGTDLGWLQISFSCRCTFIVQICPLVHKIFFWLFKNINTHTQGNTASLHLYMQRAVTMYFCLFFLHSVYIYRSLKHQGTIEAFATPTSHKCEGIVNISAADGTDAPTHTERGQSKWIVINGSRSCPGPRLECRTQRVDCCSGRQF